MLKVNNKTLNGKRGKWTNSNFRLRRVFVPATCQKCDNIQIKSSIEQQNLFVGSYLSTIPHNFVLHKVHVPIDYICFPRMCCALQ